MFTKAKKLHVAYKIGLVNCIRFAKYKLEKKFKLGRVFKGISSTNITGKTFFYFGNKEISRLNGNLSWIGSHSYFGIKDLSKEGIPNWHRNCLTDAETNSNLPWSVIPDFDHQVGDIKGVWEASRFEWAICFAQKACQGDWSQLQLLNNWLADWVDKNPFYKGANWKCGQESAIRVMHLCLVSHLLGNTLNAKIELLELVLVHLERIKASIGYAISQDNNHGTSEAAALYVGGSLLIINNFNNTFANECIKVGKRVLENRVCNLISADGSFSQNSINYHRLMLDTCTFCEFWRKTYTRDVFSNQFIDKVKAATCFLYYFVDEKTGDAPNIGSNDGANILTLTNCGYRDYRPSVQLASHLFLKRCAYENEGEYDGVLSWLGISKSKLMIKPKESKDFPDGGFAFLKNGVASLFYRYPNFKFRPSQCDSLHIDLWIDGKNILRDLGSFSYNAAPQKKSCYRSVESHNTVGFDSHEQMERLGRFMYYDWLKYDFKMVNFDSSQANVSVSYTDRFLCSHTREVAIQPKGFTITDHMTGFKNRAISRLHLLPGNWQLKGNILSGEYCDIIIKTELPLLRFEIIKNYESRFYYQEEKISTLEIEVGNSGVLIMEINLK